MKKKLQIGILAESDQIPAWTYEMFSKISNSPGCELVTIIKIKTSVKRKKIKHFVYNLYTKLDSKFFRVGSDATEIKPLKNLKNKEIINFEDIENIQNYNFDILIYTGEAILNAEILKAANYGVWSFYFGNSKNHKGPKQIFWEIINRKSEIEISLEILKEGKNEIITKVNTLPDNLSVKRSKNNCFWKAAALLPRKIDEIYRLGEYEFYASLSKVTQETKSQEDQIQEVPSNLKALLGLFMFKWRRLTNILRSFFFFDQWILLFRFGKAELLGLELSKFIKILPPKDRFWADPHVIIKNNIYYIFIEELIYAENKGFISVIEMDSQGNYKDPIRVLEKEYHLSFPFIFEDNNEIYMIPESKQHRDIQLYKCVDFPRKWELEQVLLDNVMAVDTVITKKDNRYWLFTNMVEYNGTSLDDELFLFSSDSLNSNNWQPHSDNPIVADVKSARMAGKITIFDDIMYRPSQNCSRHYGYGMQINQIFDLDTSNYKEQIVESIYPNWDKKIISTHSLSSCEELTVIDAQYKRRK